MPKDSNRFIYVWIASKDQVQTMKPPPPLPCFYEHTVSVSFVVCLGPLDVVHLAVVEVPHVVRISTLFAVGLRRRKPQAAQIVSPGLKAVGYEKIRVLRTVDGCCCPEGKIGRFVHAHDKWKLCDVVDTSDVSKATVFETALFLSFRWNLCSRTGPRSKVSVQSVPPRVTNRVSKYRNITICIGDTPCRY